jgi:hypothetical protein
MNSRFRSTFISPATLRHSTEAQHWLQEAALYLGVCDGEAQIFTETGLLRLPGMSIQLRLWHDEPVPQWLALGLLPRPPNVSVPLWNELLLRGNCTISAMGACTAALDDRGHAVLISRLTQAHSATCELGEQLALMIALAESLVGGATALGSGPFPSELPARPHTLPEVSQKATSQASIAHDWHLPLLAQTLHYLGDPTPLVHVETIGVIRIGPQHLEIIADGDKRHLLISTPIARSLHSSAQRDLALRANLELMALTGCTLALAPHGACLQGRWDSYGLDGYALGDWLGDIAQLATALGARSPSVFATELRP